MPDNEKTVALKTGLPRKGHEHEHDPVPVDPDSGTPGQHSDYWVLSDEERAKGFVRPVRNSYIHKKCGGLTRISPKIAETYARDPTFYGSTFCCACNAHFALSPDGFTWDGSDELVGS